MSRRNLNAPNPEARITDDKRRTGANRRMFALKKELGWCEDVLRDAVQAETGQRSISKCTADQLIAVCDRIDPRRNRRTGNVPNAYFGKIKALWIMLFNIGGLELGDDAALISFCRRQTGVDDPRWIRAEDAHTVIEALKSMLDRRGVRVAADEHPIHGLNKLLDAQFRRLVELGALEMAVDELDVEAFARLYREATGVPRFQPGRDGAMVGSHQKATAYFGRLIRAAQHQSSDAAQDQVSA